MSRPIAAPKEISRRVSAVAESATLAMDRRARELVAAGENVISFAAGEPDFNTAPETVHAAIEACRDPRNHHYSPSAGLPELREAVAAKTRRDSGLEIAPSQVLITNGTKQAVAHAFATLLNPGDEVLVPSPFWVTFPEAITLAGGTPVMVPTDESLGFRTSPAQLERYVTDRTKALLFVSPCNPTGAVYSREQMEELGRWVYERGLWVVSDEIYEYFVYDGAQFNSLPAVVPELRDRTVCLNGVAKAYAMTGWRVGWMHGPQPFITAASNLHSHVAGNISNVSQRAAVAALSVGPTVPLQLREAFARRRKLILGWLERVPGFECPPPQGAFYVFPSVEGVLGSRVAGRRISSSAELAAVLLDEVRVAATPGEAFGAPGYLRFSYALGEPALEEGMSRLVGLLS